MAQRTCQVNKSGDVDRAGDFTQLPLYAALADIVISFRVEALGVF
jgi:hypothetical protein